MSTHLIFEGAELSGKSFLMSQIYPILEDRGSTSKNFLNGCFWINSDIGVFGSVQGEAMINKYLEIAEILKDKSIMFEKFHLSDMAYKVQSGVAVPSYSDVEAKLASLQFKIVLTTFDEKKELIQTRLEQRLKLYPHYQKIAREPKFYIAQQQIYKQLVKKSSLPYLEITLRKFTRDEIQPLLEWTKE